MVSYFCKNLAGVTWQRRSQNTADAEAQHGHSMFVRTSVQNAEATE